MQLLGLRVISKDGGPANMTQLFIRWICLIFDAIPYTWPFTGLVGFIVILCSRHRQRIGDHLARTLVISTGTMQPVSTTTPRPARRARPSGSTSTQPATTALRQHASHSPARAPSGPVSMRPARGQRVRA